MAGGGLLVSQQWEEHSIPFLDYCLRLLSRMAFQSSAQERRRRRGAGSWRCLLWQQVNRMCSQLGFGSAPVGRGENWNQLESAPQPAANHGNAVQTLDGVLVIKQQVSSHHGLVSGQNNPLHKLGSQVFLYPLILQRQGTGENPAVLSVCTSLLSDQP